MGLLDILNGIGGGGVASDPRTRSAPQSQGMSPMAKALLALLAIYAMKNLRRAPAAQPAPRPGGDPGTTLPGGRGGGGGLGDVLGGLLGGAGAGEEVNGGGCGVCSTYEPRQQTGADHIR